MSPEIFRKALLATARVACCAALLGGCTSHTNEQAEKPAQSLPAKTEAPKSAPASAPSSLAKSLPASTPASNPLDECISHVDAVFAKHSEPASAHTKECCEKVMDTLPYDAAYSWPAHDECCKLLDFKGPAACMPWGPPCPPPMGEEV